MTIWFLILLSLGPPAYSGMGFVSREACEEVGLVLLAGLRWICVEVPKPEGNLA